MARSYEVVVHVSLVEQQTFLTVTPHLLVRTGGREVVVVAMMIFP
jgi:hypothetical protein